MNNVDQAPHHMHCTASAEKVHIQIEDVRFEEDQGDTSGTAAKGGICFYGWTIAALLTAIKIVKCQGQNNVMSYTVPHLLDELMLSNGELGALFSFATVASSLVQPILGYSVDKFGARLCIPAAQAILSLTLLLFSFAQFFSRTVFVYIEVIVFFFFLRGLSLGALETFPSACVQKWFVRKRGRVSTMVSMLQQVGLAAVAPLVSGLVVSVGWRSTARLGALANLTLAVPSLLMLRSTPEDCGLLPDGDVAATPGLGKEPIVSDATLEDSETGSVGENLPGVLPGGLWPLCLFTFFYALMFGGCDFEMVGMISEAGGDAGGVNVALHVFLPLSITSAFFMPIVGEVMDRASGTSCTMLFLAICGMLTFFATNSLVYAGTPWTAVMYAFFRGLTSSIYAPLLNAGLAFAAFGVKREIIGQALGMNRAFAIAGTGAGPLLYGVAKDKLGNFRGSLQISSVPPLLISLYFFHQLLWATCCGCRQAAQGYKKAGSNTQDKARESPIGNASVG